MGGEALMGPGGRTAASQGAPDHITRMRALLERHPHVTWLRPGQAGVRDHTATWLEIDGDPRINGTPVTVSRESLGHLVDYLIARLDA